MTTLDVILLAIVQGATEFLPISSSGHLILMQHFLGIAEPQLLFDIVLHVGTLVAVVVFYHAAIAEIVTDTLAGLRAFAKSKNPRDLVEADGARVAALVVAATIPTGILGLLMKDLIAPDDGSRAVTATVVCAVLLLNGVILFCHRFIKERDVERTGGVTVWNLTLVGALLVGVAQGLAVMPGISRSGATITAALLLGTTRTQAAKFSFLLSIPAILGALVLQFDASMFDASPSLWLVYLVGAAVAAVVGYVCMRLLVYLLERARFHHFAWYCWAIGIAGLIAL